MNRHLEKFRATGTLSVRLVAVRNGVKTEFGKEDRPKYQAGLGDIIETYVELLNRRRSLFGVFNFEDSMALHTLRDALNQTAVEWAGEEL